MYFLSSSYSAEYVKVFCHNGLCHTYAKLTHMKHKHESSALLLDSVLCSLFGHFGEKKYKKSPDSFCNYISSSCSWLVSLNADFELFSQVSQIFPCSCECLTNQTRPFANNIAAEYGRCCHKQSETNQFSWSCQPTECQSVALQSFILHCVMFCMHHCRMSLVINL